MNPRVRNLVWAAAVFCIALLNIFDILPDWSTFLAIFTPCLRYSTVVKAIPIAGCAR